MCGVQDEVAHEWESLKGYLDGHEKITAQHRQTLSIYLAFCYDYKQNADEELQLDILANAQRATDLWSVRFTGPMQQYQAAGILYYYTHNAGFQETHTREQLWNHLAYLRITHAECKEIMEQADAHHKLTVTVADFAPALVLLAQRENDGLEHSAVVLLVTFFLRCSYAVYELVHERPSLRIAGAVCCALRVLKLPPLRNAVLWYYLHTSSGEVERCAGLMLATAGLQDDTGETPGMLFFKQLPDEKKQRYEVAALMDTLHAPEPGV